MRICRTQLGDGCPEKKDEQKKDVTANGTEQGNKGRDKNIMNRESICKNRQINRSKWTRSRYPGGKC